GQPDRAQESVIKTAKYNSIYMAAVMLISFTLAGPLAAFFSNDAEVREIAVTAIRVLATGYIFYGIGMVMINAFNGAGDTWTPTKINLVGFWLFHSPLAYMLAKHFKMGPLSVFMAVPIAETASTIAGIVLFKRGKWKKVVV